MGSALLIILMVICFGVIIFVIALIQENRRTIAKQKKKIRENTFNEEDIYKP